MLYVLLYAAKFRFVIIYCTIQLQDALIVMSKHLPLAVIKDMGVNHGGMSPTTIWSGGR